MTVVKITLRASRVDVSGDVAKIDTDTSEIGSALRQLVDIDPFNAQKTRIELLDAVLAYLCGADAKNLAPDALVRAALCQEITRREDAERQLATLTRERDEAREKTTEALASIDAFMGESMPWTDPSGAAYIEQLGEIASRRLQYTLDTLLTTPTQGAQA